MRNGKVSNWYHYLRIKLFKSATGKVANINPEVKVLKKVWGSWWVLNLENKTSSEYKVIILSLGGFVHTCTFHGFCVTLAIPFIVNDTPKHGKQTHIIASLKTCSKHIKTREPQHPKKISYTSHFSTFVMCVKQAPKKMWAKMCVKKIDLAVACQNTAERLLLTHGTGVMQHAGRT